MEEFRITTRAFSSLQKSAAFGDVRDIENIAARERRKREEMSHRYRG